MSGEMGYLDDDERCNRCGGENIIWAAPSPLWNLVMRGNDINSESKYRDLVCMRCFAVLAHEAGLSGQWRLSLNPEPDGLVKVTPSGRTWDADRWLWVDPPAPETPATALTEGEVEEYALTIGYVVCTCTPCTTPGNGGPTPGHCAACCGQTGIEEYDHDCPITEHREWAARQFGPKPAAEPDGLREARADLGREQERNGQLLNQIGALREAVEALADEWDADRHSDLTQRACAALLRAVLDHPATDGGATDGAGT